MNINHNNEELVDAEINNIVKLYGKTNAMKIFEIATNIIKLIRKEYPQSVAVEEAIQLVGRLSFIGKQAAADQIGITVDELSQRSAAGKITRK